MPRTGLLEVKNGKTLDSLRDFLRILLVEKLVSALLVPLELPSEGRVAMSLVSSAEKIKQANPLAQVMPLNAAKIVSDMTRVAPSRRKIGLVLKPCELRALVELVKLKQASLENMVLIGVDCFGTCSVSEYKKIYKNFPAGAGESAEFPAREACQVCENPAPFNADIVIGLFGIDIKKNVLIQAESATGEPILQALGYAEADESERLKREAAIAALKARRIKLRDTYFAGLKNKVVGLENLVSVLAPCVNCHNCRVACPLCYCKECFFDSSTFEWEAEKYLSWADKRGALRMPNDSLLYHLTRLNHMVSSCVGCGMCQEACPSDIPIFSIFRLTGAQVQSQFNYIPGRSLEDELPLAVFREDELGELEK